VAGKARVAPQQGEDAMGTLRFCAPLWLIKRDLASVIKAA